MEEDAETVEDSSITEDLPSSGKVVEVESAKTEETINSKSVKVLVKETETVTVTTVSEVTQRPIISETPRVSTETSESSTETNDSETESSPTSSSSSSDDQSTPKNKPIQTKDPQEDATESSVAEEVPSEEVKSAQSVQSVTSSLGGMSSSMVDFIEKSNLAGENKSELINLSPKNPMSKMVVEIMDESIKKASKLSFDKDLPKITEKSKGASWFDEIEGQDISGLELSKEITSSEQGLQDLEIRKNRFFKKLDQEKEPETSEVLLVSPIGKSVLLPTPEPYVHVKIDKDVDAHINLAKMIHSQPLASPKHSTSEEIPTIKPHASPKNSFSEADHLKPFILEDDYSPAARMEQANKKHTLRPSLPPLTKSESLESISHATPKQSPRSPLLSGRFFTTYPKNISPRTSPRHSLSMSMNKTRLDSPRFSLDKDLVCLERIEALGRKNQLL